MNTDLSDKLTFLNSLLRSGKYPKGIEFLGAGGGNFYQCTMRSLLALKNEKRTKGKSKAWDFHEQRIDALVKIARGEAKNERH